MSILDDTWRPGLAAAGVAVAGLLPLPLEVLDGLQSLVMIIDQRTKEGT
jgi:hypothetical protein